ncbi:hypothetical protein MTO96_032480 [Rhipicephalus appendiculatus]
MKRKMETSSDVVITKMRRIRPSGFPEDALEIDVAASLFSPEIARITCCWCKASREANENSAYHWCRWRHTMTCTAPACPPVPDHHEPASRLLTVYTTKLGDLVVYRPGDRQILFETDLSRLVYTPRFVQLVTLVPTTNLYGLGLGRGPLQRSVLQPHVGFNRDLQALNGSEHFFHGSHPFYMGFDRLGTSFGVYFRTSAIFEVLGHATPALTFRSLGGQVDVFVFGGPSPADVVRQYLDVVGRPAMPPFWALGLHASLPRLPPSVKDGPKEVFFADSDWEDPLKPFLTYSNYYVDVAWLPVDVERHTCEHGWHPETVHRRPFQRIVHTLVPTLSERPAPTIVCNVAVVEAQYLGLILANQAQEVLEDEVSAAMPIQ